MLTQRAADLAVLIKAQRKALSYTQVFPTLVGGSSQLILATVVSECKAILPNR